MALPQNPQGITNSDRLLLEAVNTQTDSLRTQTKVLHTVSDNIIKQNKEFVKMRKDIGEFKNAVVSSSDMLDAFKKYFGKNAQDNKSKSRSESNVNRDRDTPSKGFFKDIFGKVFGPSKYQQKLMDDTSSLLRFTEVMANDMSFIRKKYEDSARAKERELLATAIAQKMGDGGGGGGGGIFGTVLSGIGAVLTTVFTGGITLLGNAITGLGNIISGGLVGLGTAIGGIAKALGNVFAAGLASATLLLTRMLSVLASIAAAWGIKTALPDMVPPVGGAPGNSAPKPGAPPPRLPGPNPNAPRLPAPTPKAEDAKILREGPKGTTTGGMRLPPGAGFGLKLLGGAGLAYEVYDRLSRIFEPSIGTQMAMDQAKKEQEEKAQAEALAQQKEADRKLRIEKAGKDPGEGRSSSGRLRDARGKIIPRTSGMPSTGMLDEAGNLMYKDSEGKIYPNKEMAEQADKATEIRQSLNKMLDGILGLETDMENAISKGADKIGQWVDSQLEIDFGNGNKLNLMPNLGQSTVEVLKEITQETKDLMSPITDSMKGSMTNIINNVSEVATSPSINFSSMVSSTENWATDTIQKYMFGTPIK